MDSSDYDGEPHPDSIAGAGAGRGLSVPDAGHLSAPLMLPEALMVGALQNLSASVQSMVESAAAVMAPGLTGLINDYHDQMGAHLNEQMGAHLAVLVSSQQQMFDQFAEQSRFLTGLDEDWFARLAASTNVTVIDDALRQDLISSLDHLYEAPAAADPIASALDGPADDALDELAEQGLAFVAEEGQGLSKQAQQRLFGAWMVLMLGGVLATFMLQSETNKELVETVLGAAGFALPVTLAAGRYWDGRTLGSGGQDQAATSEDRD